MVGQGRMEKYVKQNLKLSGGFIGRGWRFGILLVVTVAMMAAVIHNAVDLQKVLDKSTVVYTSDITREMAKAICDIIELKRADLINVADSIGQKNIFSDRADAADFMYRKASILGFDEMLLVSGDGAYIWSSGPEEAHSAAVGSILSMEVVQNAFDGESGIGYAGEQDLYYSAPVWNGEQVQYVLVGIRSKKNMQSMIDAKSFSGKCFNCIVDNRGSLLLASEDMRPFEQLEEIFEIGSEEERQAIVEMQKNMARGEDGVFDFTAVNGRRNFLSYNSLHVNDWVIMTVVPADVISAGSDQYVLRSLLLIGGIFLALVFFWFLLYQLYNSSRRKLIETAFSDPLTGGMNGKAFQLKYQEASEKQSMQGYAVVLMDVRNFKLVNEIFGMEAGNRMLRYIYRVLKQHMREENGEFTARSETDRFFLCIRDDDPDAVRKRLDEITEEINSFRDTDCPHFPLSFRKGICPAGQENTDIFTMQDRARIAAQQDDGAAESGGVFYDERITERIRREQELDALFEESFRNRSFQVYFQPKVGVKDGKLKGAEALIRWQHPERGMIYPSDFIPLFENNGKICRLDLYVFEETCRFLSRRKKEGKELLRISVNLSRKHFYQPDFLEEFDAVFRQYDIPYETIEFELTESIFLDDAQIAGVKKVIRQMHQMGFGCSLDDFGSGFSSLGLLKDFDVDTLKLDRSFFLDISNEKARDVIQSVVELANRLHVKTVAEGIETPEQLAYLQTIHCDEIQGYIFSRPLPVPEFEQWELERRVSFRL